MAYSLFTPTGSQFAVTPITVADNTIDTSLYNAATKSGLQLVGRNAINYGTAVAQNTIQIVSNFASTVDAAPTGTRALQGQLWFNISDGSLYVKTGIGGNFPANWSRIPAINSSNPADGDIQIGPGPTISIWADGAWRQVFPAIYS